MPREVGRSLVLWGSGLPPSGYHPLLSPLFLPRGQLTPAQGLLSLLILLRAKLSFRSFQKSVSMPYPRFLGAFPAETELLPFRDLTASVGMQSLCGAAGHLLFLPRTHIIMQGGGG